jgi:hypothetical protein
VSDVWLNIFNRRRHKRFQAYDGTFAVLRSEHQFSKLCHIIDISKGGLAFQCPINQNENFNTFDELDIFISGDGLVLSSIPFHPISDVNLSDTPLENIATSKRFGFRFGDLSPEKQSRLDQFIQNHTAEEPLPDNTA